MKKRGYSASSQQRCSFCPEPLFQKQFYLFPCGHGYHCDCALINANQILGHDANAFNDVNKTAMLIDTLTSKHRDLIGSKEGVNKKVAAQLEMLQNELDGYIAAECAFCGSVMIRLVGVPLIGVEDEEEAKLWTL